MAGRPDFDLPRRGVRRYGRLVESARRFDDDGFFRRHRIFVIPGQHHLIAVLATDGSSAWRLSSRRRHRAFTKLFRAEGRPLDEADAGRFAGLFALFLEGSLWPDAGMEAETEVILRANPKANAFLRANPKMHEILTSSRRCPAPRLSIADPSGWVLEFGTGPDLLYSALHLEKPPPPTWHRFVISPDFRIRHEALPMP